MSEKTLVGLLSRRLVDETPVLRPTFERIVNRLYATGTILREESESEARLYDDALRIEPILHDYFELAGWRLTHNPRFQYYRLYPPNQTADGEEGEGLRRLRQNLTRAFAAYLLTLRHLYAMAVDTGDVNERGEVTVSLTELRQAMAVLLALEPPAQKTVRLDTYRELRAQKLARLPEGFEAEPDDMLIAIRPPILDFVSESQVLAARAVLEGRAGAAGVTAEDAGVDDALRDEPAAELVR